MLLLFAYVSLVPFLKKPQDPTHHVVLQIVIFIFQVFAETFVLLFVMIVKLILHSGLKNEESVINNVCFMIIILKMLSFGFEVRDFWRVWVGL